MLLEVLSTLHTQIESHRGLLLAVSVLSLALYHLVIYPFFLSPLKNVPGPYIHRITRLEALNKQRTLKWIRTVNSLHKKYGPVVILAPNEISVNGDSKFINDIYIKNFPKSKFYENFRNHGFKDNIFSSLENDRHLGYKKIIMGLYSKSAVFSKSNSTRQVLIEKVGQLVDQVYKSSVSGQSPDYINARSEINEHGKGHDGTQWFNLGGKVKNLGIDVYSLFGSLAMDVVSSFELGRQNGTDLLLHPEKRHIVISHRLQAGMGFWTTLAPRFWNWAASAAVMAASKAVEEWQFGIYAHAEENVPEFEPSENMTTLETLKKNGFYGVNAYSFLSDNIFAGHETTAIQLTYLTFELLRPSHIKYQQQLKQELNDYFGSPKSRSDVIDNLELLDTLPFLDALLEENSRIHTSIPGAEPRVTPCEYPVTVNGSKVVIPTNTIISCQPYSMHRVEKAFPEPESFRPERWLQKIDEPLDVYTRRVNFMRRYMMPFGKGIRMCLGMHLAQIEMKLAIANLYWHYESNICSDWAKVSASDADVMMGDKSDGEDHLKMMSMVDTYTSRPYHDECWLEWSE